VLTAQEQEKLWLIARRHTACRKMRCVRALSSAVPTLLSPGRRRILRRRRAMPATEFADSVFPNTRLEAAVPSWTSPSSSSSFSSSSSIRPLGFEDEDDEEHETIELMVPTRG